MNKGAQKNYTCTLQLWTKTKAKTGTNSLDHSREGDDLHHTNITKTLRGTI
jgi:hypothetical protein